MKPHIEEALRSLRLADQDIAAFQTLKEAPYIALASVCFHAQQAVEKCLKAVLFLHQIEFRRSHDLTYLAKRLRENQITPPLSDEQLQPLNPFAVLLRYDDEPNTLSSPITREKAAAILITIRHWSQEWITKTIPPPPESLPPDSRSGDKNPG